MATKEIGHCDAVVIGAGPYGLSAASHLRASGAEVRIFGKPMEFWTDKMPTGMLLRSPRAASNISDPDGRCTLEAFERSANIQARSPLPLETFVSYGRWFQQQLLSDLDSRNVTTVGRNGNRFIITLQNGEHIYPNRVIVAAGIGPFRKIPREFAALPATQFSHCYEGVDVHSFATKRIAVIGAGQSALECAALLHEAGAEVELIAKIETLRWIGGHPWLHRLGPFTSALYSYHDIGPAGISRLVAAPNLVRQLPLSLRDRVRTRAVRPAGSQWLPARLGGVKVSTGRFVTSARSHDGEAELTLDDGSKRCVDHVLLGTGYKVDISRYRFLSPQLIEQLSLMDGYPCLRSGFSSSVRGLHFIGATAARTFGPLLYFVTGTKFASRALTFHIAHGKH